MDGKIPHPLRHGERLYRGDDHRVGHRRRQPRDDSDDDLRRGDLGAELLDGDVAAMLVSAERSVAEAGDAPT